jgi:hypothetical protein
MPYAQCPRAVSLLPRVDQLWYKYIHMEEMLGNVPGARQIFERWMQWEPDHHGWMAYIKASAQQNTGTAQRAARPAWLPRGRAGKLAAAGGGPEAARRPGPPPPACNAWPATRSARWS